MKFPVVLLLLAACEGCDRIDSHDPIAIVTSSSNVVMTEGTMMSVEITLDQAPADDLNVQLAASGAVTVSPTSLTFTAESYDAPQVITIASGHDSDLADAAGSVQLTGADTNASIAVSISDVDTQAIIAAASSVALREGESGTFTVALAFMPTTETTVAVTSLNPAIAAVTPSMLTFTPASYATPQIVTVSGADDMNLVNETTHARLSATGVVMTDVRIDVVDDDEQRIVLEVVNVSVPEAGQRTVGVSLAYDPGTTVTVSTSSDNESVIAVFPSTITFHQSNYATPTNITLYAALDRNPIDETATITLFEPLSTTTATLSAMIDDTVARQAYGWPADFVTYTQLEPGPVRAFQITGVQAGILDTLGLIASSGSGTFRMALYTDDAGTPGTLMTGSDTANAQVNVGNSPLIINPVTLSAGTYWIALRLGGPSLVNVSEGAVTAPTCVRNVDMPDILTPWPSTFGIATCQTGVAYNVYIDTRL